LHNAALAAAVLLLWMAPGGSARAQEGSGADGAAFGAPPSFGHAQRDLQVKRMLLGPIGGLTTVWHTTPEKFAVPSGATLEFRQPAPRGARVIWTGAEEYRRDSTGSMARCPMNEPGRQVVSARVEVAGWDPVTFQAVIDVVDVDVMDISVSPIDVSVAPMDLDENSTNEETMRYFFGTSVARLRDLGEGNYRTSADKPVRMAVTVTPSAFDSIMEWRVGGDQPSLGDIRVARYFGPGTWDIAVGPLAGQQSISLETYAVTITSHRSVHDRVPDGEPITFTAVTDPPGYEDEITWLASTKFGTAKPVLGGGAQFVAQFDDTWGEFSDGGTWQWLGVRADNAMFNQDQKTGACCDVDQGFCGETTRDECGGYYVGDGSECEPEGMCCFPDERACVVTAESCCILSGGVFIADVQTCDVPRGACCFDDATCWLFPKRCCEAFGGKYQGDGTTCETSRCCQVVTFNVPKDLSECSGDPRFGKSFKMEAKFKGKCECCEYRQHVKGELKRGGRAVEFPLGPGDKLEKDTYHEDCVRREPTADYNRCYGHRADRGNDITKTFDTYKNPATRATGCDYEGTDTPGISRTAPGQKVRINVTFKGEIIDVCDGNKVKKSNTWTVNCGNDAAPGEDPETLISRFVDADFAGWPVLLAVRVYDDEVLGVTFNIPLLPDEPPIESADVELEVTDFSPFERPEPGPLPESEVRGVAAHGVYLYDWPPDSPDQIEVVVAFNGDREVFLIDLQ
jgi:hypothetical protein